MTKNALLASAAGLTLAVGIFGATVMWSRASSYDVVPLHRRDTDLCLKSAAPTAVTAVLVDGTDKLSPEHETQLKAVFQELKRETPVNGKLLIMGLTPAAAPNSVSVVFAACNPGTKRGTPFLDHPAVAPADRAWLNRYAKPMDAALARLGELPESPAASPILEAITALTTRADFDRGVPKRTLILVTDGLQLTPGVYSHFRSGDLWASYLRSGIAPFVQADLAGADVRIVYLLRPAFAARQTPAHRAFLVRWLRERGAASVSFRGVAHTEEGRS